MKKRILVITDCTDVAANELRAVLVTELDRLGVSDDVIVEPIVNAEEFSVLHGSFLARLLAESYDPSNLLILSVINPLTTASPKRARIVGTLKNGIKVVGANTGVFSLLFNDFGIESLYESSREGLKGEGFISFGGKYVHAPIAARFAATDDITSVGLHPFAAADIAWLDYKPGQILHIDNFDVAKINLDPSDFVLGQRYAMSINGRPADHVVFCASMKELADGELAIYPGSSLGKLELGRVRSLDTSASFGLKVGDILSFSPATRPATSKAGSSELDTLRKS